VTGTRPAGRRTVGTGPAASGRSIPGPDLAHELDLLAACAPGGVGLGVDEVGRGALAGPVTVGVCAIGADATEIPAGLNDSKMLSPAAREALVGPSRSWAASIGVGHGSPQEIDSLGIMAAQRLAAGRALAQVLAGLDGRPVVATVLDGTHDWLAAPADLFGAADDPWPTPVTTVVKGDMRCASVAAASVVAKVERDRLMTEAAALPEFAPYGLDGNKGYGSAKHRAAIAAFGPSALHRVSWRLPARREGMMAP
jgi:ribonuclease HII